jgi:hypothetical protein
MKAAVLQAIARTSASTIAWLSMPDSVGGSRMANRRKGRPRKTALVRARYRTFLIRRTVKYRNGIHRFWHFWFLGRYFQLAFSRRD